MAAPGLQSLVAWQPAFALTQGHVYTVCSLPGGRGASPSFVPDAFLMWLFLVLFLT